MPFPAKETETASKPWSHEKAALLYTQKSWAEARALGVAEAAVKAALDLEAEPEEEGSPTERVRAPRGCPST